MQINLQEQILNLINKMRTPEVNQAEQKLMLLVNNPLFMETIFGIIKNQQFQNWVKTIASTFLNRVITEKLEELGYKTMFAAIRSIMSSYQILPNDKRCFQRSLITLIEYIKEPEEIHEWLDFINLYLNDSKLFDTGLLLISCSAVADISSDYLCMIIESTYEQTLKKVSVTLQNSFNVNELFKNWIVVLDKLKILSQDEYVVNIVMNMCKSNNIAKILYATFELQSPTEVWLCIKTQLYELNLLKYQAAELLRKLSQYAVHINLNPFNCPLLNLIYESYIVIKNTIAIVGTNFQILQNYQCEDFITSLFGLLTVYVRSNRNLSKEEMEILMHIVCYPFLKTRDEEMYIFQESPVEFNSLLEDLCDKQQFGILKTEAARLLQTIGDCKEALQSSVMFCVECIKIKTGFIPMLENTDVKILDIQVAFQILSIYSFSLSNYSVQIQALKIILLDKRLMQLGPLDLSKIFLFLAYNYGEVFPNPFDGTIWIELSLHYNKHPTTRHMGLDFLSNISDEYFTENFMNEFIKLINNSQQRESGQIWSIITKIFQHQKNKIGQSLCLNLVNSIFLRIETQISKILTLKTKQSSLDIVNGLHILRKIISDVEYALSKQNLIQRIFDITIVYSQLIVLNIEDEIIKIIIECMRLFQGKIPNQVYNLLPVILLQFKKNGYHQREYVILLNNVVLKSEYQMVKQVYRTLLSGLMFHLFDMSTKAQRLKQNVAIANLLTLLQNFITVHGYEMVKQDENGLCELESICMRLFPAQNQKIFNKQLLAKALNLMFLCHIYHCSQNTVSYLMLYAKQNIFHKYDAYILTKLLSKIVFSEQNIQLVIQYLNLMIEITNEEQVNYKKNSKTAKTAKGKLRIKRQQELNKILEKINTPFLDNMINNNGKYPLKKEVQECIRKMKTQNIDTYKLILMNMNEQRKTKLTTLLNQIAEIQGKHRVIRKVIGVKTIQGNQTKDKQSEQAKDEDLDEQEGDQQNNFKRGRLMKKKKQSKKRQLNNIAEQ